VLALIVKIPRVPNWNARCAVEGPYLGDYKLRISLGPEVIDLLVPPDTKIMRWMEAVLREAADRLGAIADEFSRQEETRAEEEE
jgi:hypothetical protein